MRPKVRLSMRQRLALELWSDKNRSGNRGGGTNVSMLGHGALGIASAAASSACALGATSSTATGILSRGSGGNGSVGSTGSISLTSLALKGNVNGGGGSGVVVGAPHSGGATDGSLAGVLTIPVLPQPVHP